MPDAQFSESSAVSGKELDSFDGVGKRALPYLIRTCSTSLAAYLIHQLRLNMSSIERKYKLFVARERLGVILRELSSFRATGRNGECLLRVRAPVVGSIYAT